MRKKEELYIKIYGTESLACKKENELVQTTTRRDNIKSKVRNIKSGGLKDKPKIF